MSKAATQRDQSPTPAGKVSSRARLCFKCVHLNIITVAKTFEVLTSNHS